MIRVHGDPFVPASPLLPRLAEPELRAQVAGYLGGAAALPGGRRTDGEWIWPERLAESVLELGVGPEAELLEHLATRSFRLPDTVTDTEQPSAHRSAAPTEGTGPYLVDAAGQLWHGGGGGLRSIEPVGAASLADSAPVPPARDELTEVPAVEAARLLDAACARRHDDLLREHTESERTGPAPWLARIFDGADPAGRPWFSPSRARLVQAWRRERVARYLDDGRLVVRVAGRAPDPLGTGAEPVLALGWRTDGLWVWQEALSHYVRARGVAPELELLCHIERQSSQGPASGRQVSEDAARRATEVVRAGPPPWPARRAWRYFQGPTTLLRASGADLGHAEVLDNDLRWRPARAGGTARRALDGMAGSVAVEVAEADVVGMLESRLGLDGDAAH